MAFSLLLAFGLSILPAKLGLLGALVLLVRHFEEHNEHLSWPRVVAAVGLHQLTVWLVWGLLLVLNLAVQDGILAKISLALGIAVFFTLPLFVRGLLKTSWPVAIGAPLVAVLTFEGMGILLALLLGPIGALAHLALAIGVFVLALRRERTRARCLRMGYLQPGF